MDVACSSSDTPTARKPVVWIVSLSLSRVPLVSNLKQDLEQVVSSSTFSSMKWDNSKQ